MKERCVVPYAYTVSDVALYYVRFGFPPVCCPYSVPLLCTCILASFSGTFFFSFYSYDFIHTLKSFKCLQNTCNVTVHANFVCAPRLLYNRAEKQGDDEDGRYKRKKEKENE